MLTALHQSESPPVTCTHTDDDPSGSGITVIHAHSVYDGYHPSRSTELSASPEWLTAREGGIKMDQSVMLAFLFVKSLFFFFSPFSFGHYTRPYRSPPSIYTCTVWMNKTFCKCYTPYSMAYESTMPTSFWIHLRQSLFKMTTASGRITIWLAHLPFSFSFLFSFFSERSSRRVHMGY